MAQEFACTDGIRFLHVDVKDCKLFTYFRNKVRRETLRGPTLSAAPDNITLVSRLATGFGKDAAGAWLREIRRRPYVGQLNFFRLVYDIKQDADDADGSFEQWFSFCGKSLMPAA